MTFTAEAELIKRKKSRVPNKNKKILSKRAFLSLLLVAKYEKIQEVVHYTKTIYILSS